MELKNLLTQKERKYVVDFRVPDMEIMQKNVGFGLSCFKLIERIQGKKRLSFGLGFGHGHKSRKLLHRRTRKRKEIFIQCFTNHGRKSTRTAEENIKVEVKKNNGQCLGFSAMEKGEEKKKRKDMRNQTSPHSDS